MDQAFFIIKPFLFTTNNKFSGSTLYTFEFLDVLDKKRAPKLTAIGHLRPNKGDVETSSSDNRVR